MSEDVIKLKLKKDELVMMAIIFLYLSCCPYNKVSHVPYVSPCTARTLVPVQVSPPGAPSSADSAGFLHFVAVTLHSTDPLLVAGRREFQYPSDT